MSIDISLGLSVFDFIFSKYLVPQQQSSPSLQPLYTNHKKKSTKKSSKKVAKRIVVVSVGYKNKKHMVCINKTIHKNNP